MVRRWFVGLTLVLFTAGGCLSDDPKPGIGRAGPTRNSKVLTPGQLPLASQEAATRVDSLGRKILAANKDIGIQPAFICFGVQELSLFHVGTAQVCITDGLVAQCKSDAELAAALCSELGKMVAEAQAQAPQSNSDRGKPLTTPIGNDVVGGGDADRTRLAEQAFYEKDHPRSRGGALLFAQNPTDLSKQYLTCAGFCADDLAKVSSQLRLAEANPTYEKLIKGSAAGMNNSISP